MYKLQQSDFFKEWKNKYKINVFATDGMVCPATYSNESLKILFVLKDVNDKTPSIEWIDMCNQVFKDGEQPTWGPVAVWAKALLDESCAFDESITRYPDMRNDYLPRIAFINIKKEAGLGQAEEEQINVYASEQKTELFKQINAINPDIIIACGTFPALRIIFDIKNRSDDFDKIPLNFRKNIIDKRLFNIQNILNKNKPVIIFEYCHPSMNLIQATLPQHINNMKKIREYYLNY